VVRGEAGLGGALHRAERGAEGAPKAVGEGLVAGATDVRRRWSFGGRQPFRS
jgi:hypothetical protein